jgi:hypothetical protein
LKLLLDENVPRPMAQIVRILLKAHEVIHVHELQGWAGTKDIELYARAKAEGFDAVITNDTKQLSRPLEVAAIARSGLHRIEYRRTTSMGASSASVQRLPRSAPLFRTRSPNWLKRTASGSSLCDPSIRRGRAVSGRRTRRRHLPNTGPRLNDRGGHAGCSRTSTRVPPA